MSSSLARRALVLAMTCLVALVSTTVGRTARAEGAAKRGGATATLLARDSMPSPKAKHVAKAKPTAKAKHVVKAKHVAKPHAKAKSTASAKPRAKATAPKRVAPQKVHEATVREPDERPGQRA